MMQSATRTASRRLVSSSSLRSASRRCLSTAPPAQKSRSWKSSAARWAIAVGGIYYYNTSTFFAEEPEAAIRKLDTSIQQVQESDLPTVDAIVAEKRARQAQAAEQARKEAEAPQSADVEAVAQAQHETEAEGGIGGLEEEADQQGAFNPETGEINWDCPCLGGMAHGPCGDEFKEAFSCFVHSKEEPKGIECIEKFKGMQDCFRQHPDMYGAELEDDEDEVEEELRAREVAKVAGGPLNPESSAESTPSPKSSTKSQESDNGKQQSAGAKETPREGKLDANAAQDAPGSKAPGPVSVTSKGDMPKAAFDATASNEGK